MGRVIGSPLIDIRSFQKADPGLCWRKNVVLPARSKPSFARQRVAASHRCAMKPGL